MTNPRIQAAQKAIEGATPGPWLYCGCGKCGFVHSTRGQGKEIAKAYDNNDHDLHDEGVQSVGVKAKVANARQIALSPVLPAALRLLEAVEAWRDADREYVKRNADAESSHALSRAESKMMAAAAEFLALLPAVEGEE